MSTTTERIHHDYSPSQLQALEVCPAYQGRGGSSVAAETGTRLHAVAESGQDDNELSDDAVAMAAAAMDFVAKQRQLLEAENAPGEVQEIKEIYVPIDEEHTTAGYIDVALLSRDGKRAKLIDFKFGKIKVAEARENLQGAAYSLGLFHKFSALESVEVFFVQPAIDFITTAIFTREDVSALQLKIKVIVERAKLARQTGDYSTAQATIPTCLYCANLARCPAVAAKIIAVGKKYSPADVPADLDAHALQDPSAAAVGLRLANLVTAWADSFRRMVTDRVLRGDGPVPVGYELTSRSAREIVDNLKFKETALAYLTPEEYETTVEPAMTKVEKLIASKAPRGMKSATIDAFQAETEQSGAIQKKQPYAFLRAITSGAKTTEK